MISVDPLIRQAISNDNRKYLVSAVITLANNQGTLTLTNDELWENGGFAQEGAVSEDGKFTALGAAIIGSASLSIKNQDEEYSSYDFTNAKVAVNISIEGVNVSPFRVGTYTVDDAKYTEASINLTMLDNMEQFDRPYGTGVNTRMLTYPATLFQIVNAACLDCGVSLKGTSFPNSTFSVPNAFGTEGLTYREVVGMAAAIAGCYVKCTPTGLITLEWFNRTDLDSWNTAYSSGSTIPSSVLSNMHYFTSLSSQEISVDPVVITGVNIVYEKEDESGKKQSYVEPYGTSGYVITVEKNEILNVCTLQQIQSVRDRLGAQLVGLTFRKVSISHLSDPTIEAGDIAAVWDRRDRGYPMLVTRTNFTPYSLQKSVSGAETPSRNSSTRYSWSTKNHIESQKKLNSEISTREMIEQRLRDAISGAAGLFFYKDETQNPPIYYLHNYSDFDSSPIRIMISTAGVMVTANGTDANPTWYGLTVDGTMVTNLLRTTGFSFDWATGGTLSLGGQDNIDGVLQVHDANGNLIGKWNKDGINLSAGSIKGPTIQIGGNNNVDGVLTVHNASGTVIGQWDKDGLTATGKLTLQESFGNEAGLAKIASGSYYPIGNTAAKTGACLYIESKNGTTGKIQINPCYYEYDNSVIYSNRDLEIQSQNRGTGNVTRLEISSVDGIRVYNTPLTSNAYQVQASIGNNGTVHGSKLSAVTVECNKIQNNTQVLVDLSANGLLKVDGRLEVTSTKSRNVKTQDYGERRLYCYETPSPFFGDIGDGIINDDGRCYIWIDSIFTQTVALNNYQVFLQKYGEGEIYVLEKTKTYFVAVGTPGLKFGWEIKAKQLDYEQLRLDQGLAVNAANEEYEENSQEYFNRFSAGKSDYGDMAISHLTDIMTGRVY